jgi:SAM-dependent methyltransferase
VADFPLQVSDPAVLADLERAIDRESKIPRALEALGPVAGQRVVLLDSDRGVRQAQLQELGARVSAVPTLSTAGLPRGLADVVVSLWAGFRGGSPDTEAQIADAERVLRPGGRLLVVQDYGRDDVSLLLDDEALEREHVAWSRRDGWFLLHDFKVRVLHCWWTFDSIEQAHDLLVAGFGAPGTAVAQRMRRPRLSYKVAIYHRTLDATP